MEQNLFAPPALEPCFRVEFRMIWSWNLVLTSTEIPFKVAGDVKLWRGRGRSRGVEAAKAAGLKTHTIMRELRTIDKRTGVNKKEFFEGCVEPFFREPIAVLVRMWRPNASDYDIPNLVIKPVIDGFGDVQIFESDAVKQMPELGFKFEGIDRSLALTPKEKLDREIFRATYPKKPVPPLPFRVYFDFYRLARLKNNTLYNFV